MGRFSCYTERWGGGMGRCSCYTERWGGGIGEIFLLYGEVRRRDRGDFLVIRRGGEEGWGRFSTAMAEKYRHGLHCGKHVVLAVCLVSGNYNIF